MKDCFDRASGVAVGERLDTSLAPIDSQVGSLPLGAVASRIDTWVFDLDNTLYPPTSDLWPKIDQRITLYIGAIFGLDGISSRALQKYYYERRRDLARPDGGAWNWRGRFLPFHA